MAKNGIAASETKMPSPASRQPGRPSSLLDTRVVYCGDNLEQLAKLPDACVDLIYIDPAPVSKAELPFNSNRKLNKHAYNIYESIAC